MSSSRMASGEGLRDEPPVYEEKVRTELRQVFKSLLEKHFRRWKEVLPLIPFQEKFLGFDDLYDWEGQPLELLSHSPPQPSIIIAPPTLVQYKVPIQDTSDLVFPINISQYSLMKAHQQWGESAFYALARVRTHSDIQEAKNDILKMAYWVEPKDLNITNYGYEEYRLHIKLDSGTWFTKPEQSTLLPVPLDPDPDKIRDRMAKAMTRLGFSRPKYQRAGDENYYRKLKEIRNSIMYLRAPKSSTRYWKDSEIKSKYS